jgi:hypothetical protein
MVISCTHVESVGRGSGAFVRVVTSQRAAALNTNTQRAFAPGRLRIALVSAWSSLLSNSNANNNIQTDADHDSNCCCSAREQGVSVVVVAVALRQVFVGSSSDHADDALSETTGRNQNILLPLRTCPRKADTALSTLRPPNLQQHHHHITTRRNAHARVRRDKFRTAALDHSLWHQWGSNACEQSLCMCMLRVRRRL